MTRDKKMKRPPPLGLDVTGPTDWVPWSRDASHLAPTVPPAGQCRHSVVAGAFAIGGHEAQQGRRPGLKTGPRNHEGDGGRCRRWGRGQPSRRPRFADRNRFASWTGTAPLDASSGEQNRHRLSRAGNRRVNHMIHIAVVTQLRLDTEGRDHYRRKRAAGKKPKEAIRCLKRRISDAIYKQLVADALRDKSADPGGHCGASQGSSAVDLPPHIDTSDQPLPGPAQLTLQPAVRRRKSQTYQALSPAS